MMEDMTLEMAEAKLLTSLSNLVWILPCLIILENIISIGILQNDTWSTGGTLSILTTILWVVVIFKIINAAERQLNAERDLRMKKYK
ncbi:MAG: hypothetical protein ACW98F_10095 [Candidatus Hodarchaeales archaeon]|jgi:hypothetical protein